MGQTVIITDPVYLEHQTGEHVEVASRLEVIENIIKVFGLNNKLHYVKPQPASPEDVALFHTSEYIKKVRDISQSGGGNLDQDTVIGPNSFEVALSAVGGAISAVEAVLEGRATQAFALVRPPGHHAEESRGIGFCLFNNGVIALKKAKEKYKLQKVLVIDWDAHHGNGIQKAFYDDPSVLYISIHQDGIFPVTGWTNEVGTKQGEGFNINIPVSRWTGDLGYYYLFNEIIIPIAKEFKPELVFVNAGFDAHFADDASGLEVTTEGFARITQLVKEIATRHCEGKLVLLLEGGYNQEVLGHSVAAVINELCAGGLKITDPISTPPRVMKPQSRIRIDEAIKAAAKYWKLEKDQF